MPPAQSSKKVSWFPFSFSVSIAVQSRGQAGRGLARSASFARLEPGQPAAIQLVLILFWSGTLMVPDLANLAGPEVPIFFGYPPTFSFFQVFWLGLPLPSTAHSSLPSPPSPPPSPTAASSVAGKFTDIISSHCAVEIKVNCLLWFYFPVIEFLFSAVGFLAQWPEPSAKAQVPAFFPAPNFPFFFRPQPIQPFLRLPSLPLPFLSLPLHTTAIANRVGYVDGKSLSAQARPVSSISLLSLHRPHLLLRN